MQLIVLDVDRNVERVFAPAREKTNLVKRKLARDR